jgi:hypothetical protein
MEILKPAICVKWFKILRRLVIARRFCLLLEDNRAEPDYAGLDKFYQIGISCLL